MQKRASLTSSGHSSKWSCLCRHILIHHKWTWHQLQPSGPLLGDGAHHAGAHHRWGTRHSPLSCLTDVMNHVNPLKATRRLFDDCNMLIFVAHQPDETMRRINCQLIVMFCASFNRCTGLHRYPCELFLVIAIECR